MALIGKILSGGQTGVDRAALDVAFAHQLPCGGWCPKGRRALDGRIPDRYPLQETESAQYPQRTEWNVRDSDATLILNRGRLAGGTAFTAAMARKHRKPCLIVDLDASPPTERVKAWLAEHQIKTLNVAGPREEGRPGIYQKAVVFLDAVLKA